ncbi:MAG TPA: glycine dehydrogenase (aminomethyl-transferring), partial [Saprospiraceae bacterium]|nr:glycine dehydrogenase (aminomethyl-transferring) [Saprospiraceae bacterium]
YAAYHGPQGLRAIAERVHTLAAILADNLQSLGYHLPNAYYFDTIFVETDGKMQEQLREIALKHEVNFYYPATGGVQISLDETTLLKDVEQIVRIFAEAKGAAHAFSVAEPAQLRVP